MKGFFVALSVGSLFFFQITVVTPNTCRDFKKVLGVSFLGVAESSFQRGDSTQWFMQWNFLGSDSLPGIDRDFPEWGEKALPIQLPHRLALPNHSLWYEQELVLSPGILRIQADDGAQLWVNGNRIKRLSQGTRFELLDSGRMILRIRVVNNAMSGGLNQVSWEPFPKSSPVYSSDPWTNLDSTNVGQINLSDKDSVGEMPGFTSKMPRLLASPTMIRSSNQKWFVRWVSNLGGFSELVFPLGGVEKVEAPQGIFTFPLEEGRTSFSLFQQGIFLGDFSFDIPRVDTDSIRIGFWGDSQGGWQDFKKLSSLLNQAKVDLSIGAGDLVANGGQGNTYLSFLDLLSSMQTPQLLVPGNHDYDGAYDSLTPGNYRSYLMMDSEPTYGFLRLGPVAILTLDPNENFPVNIPTESLQGRWVDQLVHSTSWLEAPWKIFVLHQPPFSQGWPGYHGEALIRDFLTPYFHLGLIDVVVSGHTHDYERLKRDYSGNPVHFFIVGGAGGSLEPLNQNSDFPKMDQLIKAHHFGVMEFSSKMMRWKVYDLENTLLDSLTFEK